MLCADSGLFKIIDFWQNKFQNYRTSLLLLSRPRHFDTSTGSVSSVSEAQCPQCPKLSVRSVRSVL